MSLLSSLLFGLVASLDAFLVGITYGIRKIHIPLRYNLLISLITLAGTLFSIQCGQYLLPLFPVSAAEISGSCILLFLGLFYLIKGIRSLLAKAPDTGQSFSASAGNFAAPHSQPENKVSSQTLSLTFSQACILGITLSLNNMGIGLGASMSRLPFLPVLITTLLFSLLFLFAGNRLGNSPLLQLSQKASDFLSGILLLLLGLFPLLDFFV